MYVNMNTKHYLAALLILALIFLSVWRRWWHECSAKISWVKRRW